MLELDKPTQTLNLESILEHLKQGRDGKLRLYVEVWVSLGRVSTRPGMTSTSTLWSLRFSRES